MKSPPHSTAGPVGKAQVLRSNAPGLMVAWDEYAVDNNYEGYLEAKEQDTEAWGDDLLATRELVINVPRDQS